MCFTRQENFEDIVLKYLKENMVDVLATMNNNSVLILKFTVEKMMEAINKGFIKLDPHSQRVPNWNKKAIEIMLEAIVLPIFNDTYSVLAVPDIMFAMCVTYEYMEETGMYQLCVNDGGHRVRVLCNFCNVEPFTYKNTFIDPCIEVRVDGVVDGVIKQLYFKETDYTRKKQLEFGNVIYLSPEKQQRLKNMEFTAKLPYQVYDYNEMSTLFNGYQNHKSIGIYSSEFLKNVITCPLMVSSSKNTVFEKMRYLTSNYPNCPEFFAHNTVNFYIIYSTIKRNSGNTILDIICADDKVYAAKVRTYGEHNTDLSGTPEEYNDFNKYINTFFQIITIFQKDKKPRDKMSNILFKSLFLILLKSKNHPDLLNKIKMNIKNIETVDREIKPIWYNKKNKDTKISYSTNDIKNTFEKFINFLEFLLLNVNLTVRIPEKESESIIIKNTDTSDDILSEITTKSDHNGALYRSERTLVCKRDFNGKDIIVCLCCNIREITRFSKQCGHIISQKRGGPDTRDNMICICKKCNGNSEGIGMGTNNLFEFQEGKYPSAPSARLYMDNIIKNDKYNIIYFKLNQLKELAKKNGISSIGVKQDVYNRVKHLLDLLV